MFIVHFRIFPFRRQLTMVIQRKTQRRARDSFQSGQTRSSITISLFLSMLIPCRVFRRMRLKISYLQYHLKFILLNYESSCNCSVRGKCLCNYGLHGNGGHLQMTFPEWTLHLPAKLSERETSTVQHAFCGWSLCVST